MRNRSRIASVVVLLVVLVALYRWYGPTPLGTRESLNVLLIGIDGPVTAVPTPGANPDSAPTMDSVALLSVHPVRGTAHLLLIPGDLPVNAEAADLFVGAEERLQVRHLIDGRGASRLIAAVESLLDVPVHHYVRLDYLGFMRLVDRLGGLEIDVAEAFAEHNVRGEVVGQVGVGRRRLSGRQAFDYVKVPAEPHAALARQEQVYAAVLGGLRGLLHRDRLHDLLRFGVGQVETDLDLGRLLAVGDILYQASDDRLRQELLPGRWENGLYVMDGPSVRRLVAATYQHRVSPSERE